MGLINDALNKIADMLSQTNWTTLTTEVNYRKKNGFVIVRGSSVSTQAIQGGVLLGTLPNGYRPEVEIDNAASTKGGAGTALVRISTNGNVAIFANPSTTYWSFAVVFPLSGSN